MAQFKAIASVTNGSQTVTVSMNATPYIKAKSIFMVASELVPYFVAVNSTWDGTSTTIQLTGAYQGATGTVDVVFVTDFTYPDSIPVIAQGDVGTAAIFTQAMYRVQDLIKTVAPSGLSQYTDLRDQCAASAATAAAAATAASGSANTFASNFTQYATALVQTQTLFAQRFAFA